MIADYRPGEGERLAGLGAGMLCSTELRYQAHGTRSWLLFFYNLRLELLIFYYFTLPAGQPRNIGHSLGGD